jgi:hypothetical protein
MDRFNPVRHQLIITDDILTPVLFRRKVEQLVGHELIKFLSDIKQLMVAPPPPHTQQFTSSVKKLIVECPVVTRSFSHHSRNKVNFQKTVVNVVHDMMTKKMVFVKREKHLSTLAEVEDRWKL